MTATVTDQSRGRSGVTIMDLFAGAGGSSSGARDAGVDVVLAANHNPVAMDVHQLHFPDTRHDCADISQVDFRRYPRTDMLWASPECTNHSNAKGVGRHRQDPTLWDAPDPSAERSRATMWDVPRAAEQLRFDVMMIENVVEAKDWVGWRAWCIAMDDLGYERRVLSINSMHLGVPQSRDRIYVAFWRKGLKPDLELELTGWCAHCERQQPCRQAWKNERTIGRYRDQYVYACTECHREAIPGVNGAETFIDMSIPCPRIGDRRYKDGRPRPHAHKTRLRIYAAMVRHGWVPVTTAGAGNTYEQTPGNRARTMAQPVDTQQTTATTALATPPPAFLLQTAHGGRVTDLHQPHPTVCASDDRLALIVPLRGSNVATSAATPVNTVAANGTHHALLIRNNTSKGDGGEMATPVTEPARTMTTKGHQSLLLPYNGSDGVPRTLAQPIGTQPTRDRWSLLTLDDEAEALIDECGLRMLTPEEIELAMGLMAGYLPTDLTKKIRILLCGNAVCPPNAAWGVGRLREALEAAS